MTDLLKEFPGDVRQLTRREAMLVYFGDKGTPETELSKSHWLKSCPECSRYAKQLVYKRYPEDFGVSEAESRLAQTHRGAQSWCLECRREKAENKRKLDEYGAKVASAAIHDAIRELKQRDKKKGKK